MNESTKSEAKLLKICREAQSFTQTINSMQHSENHNTTSAKDISKDLMRGAFDLQKSLITIGKMSSTNDMLDLDISKGSRRFEKLAMNGSLFSYIEKLKKMIKESSSSGKQEISHNASVNDLSTRSLGYLMKKERSPSLIAKLMGLEDFPSNTVVENQNLGLKRVKDVVENCNGVESFETKEKERSLCSSSRFPNKVLVQSRQSNNTFISNKKFSRKLERTEVFDNVRNKIISNQKPVKCIPDKKESGNKMASKSNGKSNASSKLMTKDSKSNPASSCRLPTKYNITRKINTVNNDHIETKTSDALRKKNQAADSWKLQNVSGPVKVKNTLKKEPVKNSMVVKSTTRATNCQEVNACTTTKQVKHHSYIRGHNTEVMVKCSKAIKTSTSNDITTPRRDDKVKVDVQILLLNSENFIMNAQELYGVSCYQNKNQLSLRTREAKLLIDCANEFMVRKKQQIELSKTFLAVACLDQMVDEISHGIENLNSYCEDEAGLSLIESVYVKMEKDIRCKRMMIDAIWDLGWVKMSCVEEVDIVAGDIEGLILCWLLEEIVVEFLY